MTTLNDQAWLVEPATIAVIDALEAAGGAGCARFVGGCVRNALMGRPIDDIDIATVLTPEQTDAAILAAGLKSVPTGIAHGTVTAVAAGRPFEITTLRRDVTTDGRNATVAFTDNWHEDAARRDFRLNAVYADRQGGVFDPTGMGVADAAAGRIIFVGDPATRIQEDYLRILRFFRFFAWYGKGPMDAAGLQACRDLAPGMSRLSAERVSRELMKLLSAPDPTPALRAMADAGVLAEILHGAEYGDAFEAVVRLDADPVARLSNLLAEDAQGRRAVAARLRLPNATRDRLVDMALAAPWVSLRMSGAELRAVLYRHGRRAVVDALIHRMAQAGGGDQRAQDLHRQATEWPVPRLPVGGKDVARLGQESGPRTGQILKAFEDSWIADDFPSEGHAERLAKLVNPPPA